MSRTLRAALGLTAVLATGLLLLADSARQCPTTAVSATYLATGDCGVSQAVTLSQAAGSCEVDLSADVGIPQKGDLGDSNDPRQGGWGSEGELWPYGRPSSPPQGEDGGSTVIDGGLLGDDAGLTDAGVSWDGGTAADAGPAEVEFSRICTAAEVDGGEGTLLVSCLPLGASGTGACTETLTPQ